MGAVSIISLSIVKKQVFSSKVLAISAYRLSTDHNRIMLLQVHPIFILSVADLLLSLLWVIGGGVWLRKFNDRVWCYAISLPTIVSHTGQLQI